MRPSTLAAGTVGGHPGGMGRIIVGVDGSRNSAAALRWAVAEGRLRDLAVTAVYVWGYYDPPAADDGSFEPAYSDTEAQEALRRAVADALGEEAAEHVDRRVVFGQASRALLDAAADAGADLVVVGARGVGGFRGMLLGSVAQQCLHHTDRPLAVVPARDEEDATPEGTPRVVVGVDGSAASRWALEWALDEGRLRRATVDVVHAWHLPYVVGHPLAPVPVDTGALEEEARRLVDQMVDGADTRGLPRPPERIVVMGNAARVVLDVAEGADLIVLGSRGLGGFAGLLLGSVTQHVVNHADCPVVVIPSS